jgi:hypothetical protein
MNFLFYPKHKINIDNEKQKQKQQQVIKIKDTVPFSVKLTEGFVVSISNEYSILIATKLPFNDSPLYRFIIKFNSLNIPDVLGRFDERGISELLKKDLIKILLHKTVTLKNVITNNYKVFFADVYINNLHINEWMIQERFAVHESHIRPRNWLSYKLDGLSYKLAGTY